MWGSQQAPGCARQADPIPGAALPQDSLPGWRGWYRTRPPMQEMAETLVQSLGREDPREEGVTAHPSILAQTVPWPEEPVGCGGEEADTAE